MREFSISQMRVIDCMRLSATTPVTAKEIAAQLGFRPTSVNSVLQRLLFMGVVTVDKKTHNRSQIFRYQLTESYVKGEGEQ